MEDCLKLVAKRNAASVTWNGREWREEKMAKPDLIIDSNERGSLCDSVTRKANKEGLTVVRKALMVGDYLLGEACIEAKSINAYS